MTTTNPSTVNAANVRRLERELAAANATARAWRSSFHSLRIALEGRLDRLEDAVEQLLDSKQPQQGEETDDD